MFHSKKILVSFVSVMLILSGFVLSGCGDERPSSALAIDAIAQVSATADVDGMYETACMNLSPDSLIVSIKFDHGKFYQVYKMYSNDTTCSTTASYIDSTTFTSTSGYVLKSNLADLSVTSVPSQFFLYQGVDVNTSAVGHAIIYKTDATHLQLYADDTAIPNYGTQWSDWTSGDAQIAGFAADPINYTGTGTVSNIPLVKVNSL